MKSPAGRGGREVGSGAVALLLLLSMFATVGALGSAHGAVTPWVGVRPVAAPASTTPAAPPSAPPSSGPGTFWDNQLIPTPGAANESCAYESTCMNDTAGPSIVSTPSGILAAAYTAFTNASSCAASSNQTMTEIGVTVSKNGGSSWNAPIYLNNPDCTHASEFPSSFSPSLAILGNGTFALAYIEYNASSAASCSGYIYYPAMNPCFLPYDDLVIRYSYDDGATWTGVTILNATTNTALATFAPVAQQPKLAAVGDTLYLTWTNFTYPEYDNSGIAPSIGLNLVVSTNGGTTWGTPIRLPIQTGLWGSSPTWVGYAPALLVNATGTLFVAYATDLNSFLGNYCDGYGCALLYPSATESVVVAQSSNNGSTFAVSTVATQVPVQWNGPNWANNGPGTMVSPAPAITVDPTTGQMYLAYAGGEVGTVCFSGSTCGIYDDFTNVWVSNSTNGGANWSAPVALGDAVLGLSGAAIEPNYLFLPSIGVDGHGTVYVDAAQENLSSCIGGYCGLESDLIFESTDHAAHFPTWYTPYPAPTVNDYPLWDGIESSMTIYQGIPYMAWTLEVCPGNGATIYCGAPSDYSWSQVVISSPFSGTGITVTFTQTGLPVGANWSIALSGNLRSGPASGSLSVSGVPVGFVETWNANWVNTSGYGLTYASNFTRGSPGTFAANTTLSVVYTEEALVTITTVPPGDPGYSFNCPIAGFFTSNCATETVGPWIGSNWTPLGASLSYGIAPSSVPLASCYECMNVSFLRWTGSGAGSWTTTVPNGSSVIRGPVNETASFNLLSICDGGVCTNISYEYTFTEVGLPAGTTWSVGLDNGTVSSATPSIGFNGTQGPVNFTVWVVPYNATYAYYGSPSSPSPLSILQGAEVVVHFTLQRIDRESSLVTVAALGLPAGTSSWEFGIGSTEYAITGNDTFVLPNGAVLLSAATVYGPSDIGAYPTGFTVVPETVGAVAYSVALGAPLNLSGPSLVVAHFSPEYRLSVTSGPGGNVSGPTGAWVASGVSVNLTAVPDAGNAWVGWTGVGAGSYTGSQLSITVRPTAPVSELATFVGIVPTYTLNVTAEGVPSGTPVTVSLGAVNYTDVAPFSITGLSPGTYPVAVPSLAPNASVGFQYAVASVVSSLPMAGGALSITASGTLTISYTAEVSVYVGASANGTTNPAPGSYWQPVGVPLTLTELPANGFAAAGWNGTGAGSVTAASGAITLSPTGPVTESPMFALAEVSLPPTYNLTLTETGLPAGTEWGASIGAEGASAPTATLVLGGLNGTVTVIVATVPGAAGVRYVPTPTGTLVETVNADQTATVDFTTEYFVSVFAGAGGSVTPSTVWANASSIVALTATANASSSFVNWSGSGPGAYSGTSSTTTLTVNGPITEIATFASPAHGTSPSSGSVSYALPIGLLVALLVVGVVVGFVVTRRRDPPPPAAPEEVAEPEPEPSIEEPAGPETPV